MAISDSTARRYELRDPDVRLMLQVRDNDAEAFAELTRRYQNRVLSLLEHLVGRGHQRAEDLTQDVFLRVWRARGTYKPGSKFSTWLFTITNNVASNARRSQARKPEVQVSSGPADSQAGPTLDEMASAASGSMPVQRIDKKEQQYIVRGAVDQLPDRQRLAVLLKSFENASYADIAEIMELTPQAVKSLLSRARNNLRELLIPYIRQGEIEESTEGDSAANNDNGTQQQSSNSNTPTPGQA